MLSEDISVYVNDAFASSHRSHTSVDGICKFVKEKAVGLLMEQELKNLNKIDGFKAEGKKIAVISSGAKVSTKIGLLENLIDCADDIFIAGAMANTFFAALGYEVGTSLFEEDMIDTAKDILAKAKTADCNIHLPVDAVCAYELKENANTISTSVDNIPASMIILDAGEKTVAKWSEDLKQHDLILMNGPLGVFEKAPFDKGTNDLFTALKDMPGYKVAGGGDTIFAINKAQAQESFDFISTGGGALLEALEGKELPGIKAISK
jgi:phosphoglycerate kinase